MSSSAISGMRAGSLMLDVAGHNAANLDTPGFHAQRVDLAADASGGVSTSISTASEPGVDLAQQAVDLVVAPLLYGANAKMLKTQDEIARSTIDLVA